MFKLNYQEHLSFTQAYWSSYFTLVENNWSFLYSSNFNAISDKSDRNILVLKQQIFTLYKTQECNILRSFDDRQLAEKTNIQSFNNH